ncbi:MAG TPA: NAD-dependent protein deacetylase, partial [Gammaproteobacteria bacterium]|nr:NAD-dependent protein deacetylase [Gammaproteobacteria bacterium]
MPVSATNAFPTPADPMAALADLIRRSRRLVVLTGAGCSTESGIPDYRDENGDWKHKRPVQFQDFVASESMRRRYWARSLVGWKRMANAQPNAAHRALAALETAGHIHGLITQNVDGLHHKAGSRKIIDLHGRLDCVECLDCRSTIARKDFQAELDRLNPGWRLLVAGIAPDGDALLENVDFDAFKVPACRECGGILKPGVVFFGEAIPRERAAAALGWLEEADALLVVGSSLMVWSGYRFARRAAERGIPIAAINLG